MLAPRIELALRDAEASLEIENLYEITDALQEALIALRRIAEIASEGWADGDAEELSDRVLDAIAIHGP